MKLTDLVCPARMRSVERHLAAHKCYRYSQPLKEVTGNPDTVRFRSYGAIANFFDGLL
jgi:hypothetical protein